MNIFLVSQAIAILFNLFLIVQCQDAIKPTLTVHDLNEALKLPNYPECESQYTRYKHSCKSKMRILTHHIKSIDFSKPEYCCAYWKYLWCIQDRVLEDPKCADGATQRAFNASFKLLEYQTRETSCEPEKFGCNQNAVSRDEEMLRKSMEFVFVFIALLMQFYLFN